MFHNVLDIYYYKMTLDYTLGCDVCYSRTAPCINHSAPLLIAGGTTHREREREMAVAVAAEDKNKRRKVVVMAALKTCSAKQTDRVQVTALNDS
jgi:hypothetical protein